MPPCSSASLCIPLPSPGEVKLLSSQAARSKCLPSVICLLLLSCACACASVCACACITGLRERPLYVFGCYFQHPNTYSGIRFGRPLIHHAPYFQPRLPFSCNLALTWIQCSFIRRAKKNKQHKLRFFSGSGNVRLALRFPTKSFCSNLKTPRKLQTDHQHNC